ncbi:MAG: glpE, partial [Acidobacteria bacterium]|nr:glpE [Acidobacteriota bacterium]
MAHQHSPQFLKLVEDSKSRIREIDAPGLLQKLPQKAGFRLIDVREAEEYAAGRIPGAQ